MKKKKIEKIALISFYHQFTFTIKNYRSAWISLKSTISITSKDVPLDPPKIVTTYLQPWPYPRGRVMPPQELSETPLIPPHFLFFLKIKWERTNYEFIKW